MTTHTVQTALIISAIAIGTCFSAQQGQAQEILAEEQLDDPLGAQRHDGMLLRMSGGLGAAPGSFRADANGDGGSGASLMSNIAVGYAVADNLILHIDFTDVSILENDGDYDNDDDYRSVSMNGTGIGATYYFMPHNVYVSGSLGAYDVRTKRLTDEKKDNVSDDIAFGVNAIVGKEWWVSDNWGLGLAGMVNYVDTPVAQVGETDSDGIVSYGLIFSATYN